MTARPNPGYIDDKDELRNRLRRIAGQVGGLERMVADERYCIEIVTQVAAVQAALDRVAVELLDDHARRCVVGATAATREAKAEEMVGAVARLIRSR